MDFSNFITNFDGSSSNIDMLTTVSNSIQLTYSDSNGSSYYGRYFCLGDLLIQFTDLSDPSNNIPNHIKLSKNGVIYQMYYPIPYDSNPYIVMPFSMRLGYPTSSSTTDASWGAVTTLSYITPTDFSFRISDYYSTTGFLAIGPRPSSMNLFSPYRISNLSNLKYTPFSNSTYTGFIFEITTDPSDNNIFGTGNLLFYNNTVINCVIVGGGGGGGGGNDTYTGGGGGGGGGIIYTTLTAPANQYFNIQVGAGGAGCPNTNGGNGGSSGSSGSNSSFSNLQYNFIANGGSPGLGMGTTVGYTGGPGGNASSNFDTTNGGGGGGSGGGAALSGNFSPNSAANAGSVGYLNSSHNPGIMGIAGSLNGTYSGQGGNSFYPSISAPFTSTPSYIYAGNAGGGGSGTYGGSAGYTTGGAGTNSISSTSGISALYGLNNNLYFYGNGGGGGSLLTNSNLPYNSPNKGGNGGNGVVIIWFSNT